MKRIAKISLQKTGFFGKQILDYVEGTVALRPFYKYDPEIEAIEQVIADKSNECNHRQILVDELLSQYSHLPHLDKTQQHIQQVCSSTCFTITTAHQPCLFTGPLYFIYKIASTIKLCRQLSDQFSEHQFVPVYWMGSEDHDFEEINHLNLFNRKMIWNQEANGAVGDLSVNELFPLIEELKDILGDRDQATHLKHLIDQSFKPEMTYKACFQTFVSTLFAEFGLIVIDPDKPSFKKLFRDVVRTEMFDQISEKLVIPEAERLAKNYLIQAKPRQINFFYKAEGIRSRFVLVEPDQPESRTAADKNDYQFEVLDTHLYFTPEAMDELIENQPEVFSPNVILRPLYQQRILPNLAYIGGPSELSYWMELKPVFEHFKVNFPMLIPRNSALIIDKNSAKKLEKLDIKPSALFKHTDDLINDFIGKNTKHEIDLDLERKALQTLFGSIRKKAALIDESLSQKVDAETQRSLNSLSKLEERFRRAEKSNQEVAVNQIKSLKAKLFPEGSLQERHSNFIPFFLKNSKFFHELIEIFDPFDSEFLVIEE